MYVHVAGVNMKMCKTIAQNTLKSTWNEKDVVVAKSISDVSGHTVTTLTLYVLMSLC